MESVESKDVLHVIQNLFVNFDNNICRGMCNFELGLVDFAVDTDDGKVCCDIPVWWDMHFEEDPTYRALCEHCGPITGCESKINYTQGKSEGIKKMQPTVIMDKTPIEYIMFHICTSIVFDFIIDHPTVQPQNISLLIYHITRQTIGQTMSTFSVNGKEMKIRKLIKNYWKQIPLVYTILERHDIVNAWMRVCGVVEDSINIMGITHIYTDITQACYQLTNTNGDYMFANYSMDTPSNRGVYLDPEQDINQILQDGNLASYDMGYEETLPYKGGPYVGVWQNKFDRDYLIPVFYKDMDFVKVPMRAYKKLFDIFRVNYLKVNVLYWREVGEITPYDSRGFVIEFCTWGLSVAIKSLLMEFISLHTTNKNIDCLQKALLNINLLLKKNINSHLNVTLDMIIHKMNNISTNLRKRWLEDDQDEASPSKRPRSTYR